MTDLPTVAGYNLPSADQLPTPVPPWTIDERRAVLLVHDMQSYFIEPLRASGLADRLTDNIVALVRWARAAGIPVAYTAQPGRMTRAERGLLYDFWGEGMTSDEEVRQIIPEVAPMVGDWRHTKWRYSAFIKTDLDEKMAANNRDQIIICGVYAGIGILSTAIDAYSRDIETFIVADSIADFTHLSHSQALDYAAKCCAVVLATSEVIQP